MSQRNNILQELTELDSKLAGNEPVMPYAIPEGYFQSLLPEVMRRIRALEAANAQEETTSLSPLLGSLSKKMPFSVPEGYFESVVNAPAEKGNQVKVVSLTSRKWFRYAAAAAVTGIFFIAGYFLLSGSNNEPGERALAKFTRDVRKLNETQKENLIEFIDVTPSIENGQANRNDVRELLKDIPVEELRDLAQQTEDLGEVLMIN